MADSFNKFRVFGYDDGYRGFVGLAVSCKSTRGDRWKHACVELTRDEARELIAKLERQLEQES
jgi:hypothetical protein